MGPRQGLGAVDGQQGDPVEGLHPHPLLVLGADVLAGILVEAVGAGVIAARRDRQRQTADDLDLELHRGRGGERRERARRQLDRQRDAGRAAPREDAERALVVDVDEGADGVGPSRQQGQRRHLVGLDQRLVRGREIAQRRELALAHHQGRSREHHLLAGAPKSLDHLGPQGLEEGHALGAHHLAQAHAVDRRLVRETEVEIAPPLERPVEEQGTDGELGGHRAAPLLNASSCGRRPRSRARPR